MLGTSFMRTLLIAFSMASAIGVASPAWAQQPAACDRDAVAVNKEELARLTALRRLDDGAVSHDVFVAASQRYVQSAEACFNELYGAPTQKIDDGGLFLKGDDQAAFVLFGTKWGAGSPYSAYGGDNTGPHRPAGTVTYSFMNSGVDISAEQGGLLSVALTSLPTYQACFETEIANAMAAWSAVTNIQFVQVADNGAPFNANGATGDIRIGAHAVDGAAGVLAHGFYPPPNGLSAAGDLHFDAAENWSCEPGAGLIDIGLVTLHELGHVLGLDHETRSQRRAVMNPYYNPSVANVLLGDDVDGAINIYGSATGASDDLVVNFGADGLWRYDYGNAWSQLHAQSPQAVVTADLDGNGVDDLIVNFGTLAGGLWVYQNKTTWFQLNTLAPTHMAAGDLDGNGMDDVIASFAGEGVWAWYNSTDWVKLHALTPSLMTVGNIDGFGGDDLIVNFPGQGIWSYRNNSSWSQIHATDASIITVARLDNAARAPALSGLDDLVIAFPGYGLYQYVNDSSWSLLHPSTPQRIAVGDLDLDGRDDLTIDFGPGVGLWTLTNGTAWAPLHPLPSAAIAMGDLDGNGQDEIIVDFGAGIGVWLRVNNSSWVQLHPLSAAGLTVVDFN